MKKENVKDYSLKKIYEANLLNSAPLRFFLQCPSESSGFV